MRHIRLPCSSIGSSRCAERGVRGSFAVAAPVVRLIARHLYAACVQITALVFYVFCTWIIESFVINFVTCIVLVALDFWTVSKWPVCTAAEEHVAATAYVTDALLLMHMCRSRMSQGES